MPREYIDLISSDEEDEGVARILIIDLTSDDEEVSRSMSSHSDYALHRVNQHQIQKNNQRSSLTRSVFTTLPQNCRECAYNFTNNNDEQPLSERRSFDLCAGCSLLNANIKATDEDPTTVKHWLCTGEISIDDWNDSIDTEDEKTRIVRRARGMKVRFRKVDNGSKKNPSYRQSLPSDDDLLKMVVDKGYKCAITSWICHFGHLCEKSWSVSFDHIVPISVAPPRFNPWVSSNIQITCNLLNKIKGSLSDAEVHRWFKIWKDANIMNY